MKRPSELPRRAVLGGMAASAAASSACSRPPPASAPQLSFVGQSPQRGHRLRTAAVSGSVRERHRVRTLIVGGGAAGTAAAWRLHRAGMDDFLLAELEDAPGGTAQSGGDSRTRYPLGAHYLPSPHPTLEVLRELLRELNVETGVDAAGRPEYDPMLICRAPMERHRYRGRWFAGVYPQLGETGAEAEQWSRWRDHLQGLDAARGSDGRRLFELPVECSSDDSRHLSQTSMAAYLDARGFDSWRLRWTVDYACRDEYGTDLGQTSAFAGLHRYLCRGLEEVHGRVTLMWPGGNGDLIEQVAHAARLGGRRRTGWVVSAIDPQTGLVKIWRAADHAWLEVRADQILWAAPRFILPHVLRAPDPLPRGSLTYAPWLVANVAVDRRPGGFGRPLSWDNVQVGAPHLGYVVATHGESLADAKTRTDTVLSFYEASVPGPSRSLEQARRDLLQATLPQLGAHVTAALEGMHPGIAPTIRRIEFARWGHAMIRPVPGLLFSDRLAQAAAPLGRVLPCATDVGGVPVFEQALCNGVRAAEAALARSGERVEPMVPPRAR